MGRRYPRDVVVAVALGGVCLLALLVNLGQPLVRNGLVYARVTQHIIAHHYNPHWVVADSRLSYDKPILFGWLAAPLVARFGTQIGLMLASTLGTLALIAATLQLVRTFAPAPDDGRLRARALLFGLLSPLLVYQTWSAHPDSLEVALTLSAVAQVAGMLEEPQVAPGYRSLLLFATIEAGVLLKNYGLILLFALPAAFAPELLRCWRAGQHALLRGLGGAWLAVAALAVLAFAGLNPLDHIHGEGGGLDQYGQANVLQTTLGAVIALALTLGLCLHVALPAALVGRAAPYRIRSLLVFLGVYVAGLLPFPSAYYNMRYFLPAVPIVGLRAAIGLEGIGRRTALSMTAGFVVVALLLVALFNVGPLYALAAPFLPELRPRADLPGMLDNLRMGLHREQRQWLDELDRALPAGAVVYMVGFSYYGDAQWGVYEQSGKIRPDLTTRYVRQLSDLTPAEREFFVCFWQGVGPGSAPPVDRTVLERLGHVDALGPRLFRVRRAGDG
ncbi:MAG TPA: hypothetical protein VEH80_05715 [Candidatus Bathyarchaeia archaeon]|nr:hypothetical protein [Candidatus Bathyarchaeia archaeon]